MSVVYTCLQVRLQWFVFFGATDHTDASFPNISMEMDLHPIFVHFPIAFLTLYSFLEVFRLPVIKRQNWWFYTKAVLVIAGVIGGFFAVQTGEIAEEAFRGTPTMDIVHLHEEFAEWTMRVYGFLALLYAIAWVRRDGVYKKLPASFNKVWQIAAQLEQKIAIPPVLIIAAIAGFVLLSITGAFGGALVYGKDSDPLVSFLYDLFINR